MCPPGRRRSGRLGLRGGDRRRTGLSGRRAALVGGDEQLIGVRNVLGHAAMEAGSHTSVPPQPNNQITLPMSESQRKRLIGPIATLEVACLIQNATLSLHIGQASVCT